MPRLARRRGRGRSGVGRKRTGVVDAVFELEQMYVATLAPGSSIPGSFNTQSQSLNMWQTNGGGPQAVMYVCNFPLSFLNSSQAANFGLIAQLYDYVKLKCVDVILKSLINPKMAVNVSNTGSGTYNFTDWPGQDPVITYVDYDGFTPMQNVGGTGAIACPANGDMTQLLYNKPGARRHAVWGTIRRRFIPRRMLLCASDGNTPNATPVFMQGGRAGWLTNAVQAPFFGSMIIAIPYVGQSQSGGYVNHQVNGLYSIMNKWYVSFKVPLYG